MNKIYLPISFINAKIEMSLNYIFLIFKNVTLYKISIEFILENVYIVYVYDKPLIFGPPKVFSFLIPFPQKYSYIYFIHSYVYFIYFS